MSSDLGAIPPVGADGAPGTAAGDYGGQDGAAGDYGGQDGAAGDYGGQDGAAALAARAEPLSGNVAPASIYYDPFYL